eukprot:1761007-Lingulodinium_polyedra.AAC.1
MDNAMLVMATRTALQVLQRGDPKEAESFRSWTRGARRALTPGRASNAARRTCLTTRPATSAR